MFVTCASVTDLVRKYAHGNEKSAKRLLKHNCIHCVARRSVGLGPLPASQSTDHELITVLTRVLILMLCKVVVFSEWLPAARLPLALKLTVCWHVSVF